MKASPTSHRTQRASTRERGAWAEQQALLHLQGQGLSLLVRNYRTPGRGGGEIDLIMQTRDGTVVFVEVRHRQQGQQGGAAASVGRVKRRRIVFAARFFLARLKTLPPCRFDVVAFEGETLNWIRAAFDASEMG
jgi:putative endonuclease